MGHLQELTVCPISLEIRNEPVEGKTIKEIKPLVNRDFAISRIRHCDGDRQTELVNSTTVFHIHLSLIHIYKRFAMNDFKEAFTVSVTDALDSHCNTLDLRMPLPVSYTHLDVYKRQLYNF